MNKKRACFIFLSVLLLFGIYQICGYQNKKTMKTFIKDYGFEEKEPFYQYVDETSGNLQLELYYDASTGKGCGTLYLPEHDWKAEEFVFDDSDKFTYSADEHLLRDKSSEAIYSKLTYDGYDASQDIYVEDFKEKTEYTDDGRMEHYLATGWITYLSDEKSISTIMEMNFEYREDGTLQSRVYQHNYGYGGSWCSSMHSFYDSLERLVCEKCYITHGYMYYFYIYAGQEKEPSYYLVIDQNLDTLYAELISCHDIC